MLTVSDVSLRFSDRKLFDEVNIKFTAGNTYGLIGANGAENQPSSKSWLAILSQRQVTSHWGQMSVSLSFVKITLTMRMSA